MHGDGHYGGAGAGEQSVPVSDGSQESRHLPLLSHRPPGPGVWLLYRGGTHI